ncbi:nitroreductase family protein [candidate division KSB1 bacterium]|nr:nitroreductase family protein [candidate division KSB1 bacterium]RQW05073.1 MAG: nitroreductase [candidate division KSB1 bacterium]
MSVYETVQRRRTIRRFQPKRVPLITLRKIVDSARMGPSAMNLQPWEFIIVDSPELVRAIYANTQWAGYLPKEQGPPPPGKEPTAFIVVLRNVRFASKWTGHDIGAAVENMILVALEEGIGSCWIASVSRPTLRPILNIPDDLEIDSVLALGYPDEQPMAFDLDESVKYFRDAEGRLHVPKRTMDSVVSHNKFGQR